MDSVGLQFPMNTNYEYWIPQLLHAKKVLDITYTEHKKTLIKFHYPYSFAQSHIQLYYDYNTNGWYSVVQFHIYERFVLLFNSLILWLLWSSPAIYPSDLSSYTVRFHLQTSHFSLFCTFLTIFHLQLNTGVLFRPRVLKKNRRKYMKFHTRL